MRRRLAPVVLLALARCTCGPVATSEDGGGPDASTAPDASAPDSGPSDAGVDAGSADAGSGDAGAEGGTDAGFDSGVPLCTPPVNGCQATDYVDGTDAGPVVQIVFGGDAGFTYLPRCLRIAAGQSARFVGQFTLHSLYETCGPVRNMKQPFPPTVTSATFSFAQPGDYGYICTEHWTTYRMGGAIQVVP